MSSAYMEGASRILLPELVHVYILHVIIILDQLVCFSTLFSDLPDHDLRQRWVPIRGHY